MTLSELRRLCVDANGDAPTTPTRTPTPSQISKARAARKRLARALQDLQVIALVPELTPEYRAIIDRAMAWK